MRSNLLGSLEAAIKSSDQVHRVNKVNVKWLKQRSAPKFCQLKISRPILNSRAHRKLSNLSALLGTTLKLDSNKSKYPGDTRTNGSADNSSSGSVHKVKCAQVGNLLDQPISS